jgi:hypothetical protein
VLADGRQVILTNRVRNFSDMASQVIGQTKAAQLIPYSTFIIDGGTLDFDKFGLAHDGLVHKGKLIPWSDFKRISLNRRGTLLFKSETVWWSPSFSMESTPNAALLLDLLAVFGVHCVYEA